MNFDLSEEQALFKATIERFAGGFDTAARHRLRMHDGGYDPRRWCELANLGLIALCVSPGQGGLGGSPVDLALVGEALGAAIAPDPWLENGVLSALLLAAAGADGVLTEVMAGERFVAAALAERQIRFSMMPRQTHVEVKGDKHILRGEKTFVLGGALADSFIVSAERGGACEFYLLGADQPGLERRFYRLVDGSLAAELRFVEVELSDQNRLAISVDALTGIVADVRLLAAAEMVGLAQRLFDDTLIYVKQREQFGVPIGTFQAIQHRLVDCYAKLEQARSMLLRAALHNNADEPTRRAAAAGAKAFVGEQAGHIAREAVQLHGGMGITDELSIGHAMKRVLLLNALLGDSDAALVDYAVAA